MSGDHYVDPAAGLPEEQLFGGDVTEGVVRVGAPFGDPSIRKARQFTRTFVIWSVPDSSNPRAFSASTNAAAKC